MLIANPIYDKVFKRLLENERIARFFIGTLLGENVESVELKPQEFVYDDPQAREPLLGLRLFRLDFVAIIKTAEGTKKVLIEVQKADNFDNLVRFRNYLAENYKRQDAVDGAEQALPITTIYILDFNLPWVESACIKVARECHDLINNVILPRRDPFIEKLTHDCFIVQTRRIEDRYRTRLDKLLSLFEQRHFIEENGDSIKTYAHAPTEEELKMMLEMLNYVASNPDEREKLDNEREGRRMIEAYFGKFYRQIDAQEAIIAEKDATLAEKDASLAEKDAALAEKETTLAEKETTIAKLTAELKRRGSEPQR